ncbi:MAG: bifunctional FO biosynthesis protein CofGH [Actinomycetes bacterium]
MRRALRRASDGVSLDAADARVLLTARGDDLAGLCVAAGRVRDAGLAQAGRAGVITYSPKVFVPLTRLCRDRCHYCTFAATPRQLGLDAGHPGSAYLSPDEVLEIATRGAQAGCTEALFTLGDRPEDRWPQARAWLQAHGYDSTVDYLRAMAIRVLEETGLLPHLNPGVMSWDEMVRVRPVAVSLGLMLETTSQRLWAAPGQAHHASPDKEPAVRLRMLTEAGRLAIPFTTGLLVGIGETLADRVQTLLAIRQVARQYHSVQEVIVQNFRAKPGTPMRDVPDLDRDEHAATVAVARLLLGAGVRVQVPPNLAEPDGLGLLLAAGIDDWGGVSPVTADHVNPERPWPDVAVLAAATADAGFQLQPRLAVYPRYVRDALAGAPWIDPRLHPHVTALADPQTGLVRTGVRPRGLPWQEPDDAWSASGRIELHAQIDVEGRRTQRRSDDEVYGDWAALPDPEVPPMSDAAGAAHEDAQPLSGAALGETVDPAVLAALRRAADIPGGLTDEEYLVLIQAEGAGLEALTRLANEVRRDAVGDTVTYVVNRNINVTNVCYTGCRFCAFAQRRTDADAYTLSLDQVVERATEAWAAGASEVCLQSGIDPALPGSAYLELASRIRSALPDLHLHAFSPMEIVNGASRLGVSYREFLEALRQAGVGTIPGTAAEILDDEVRWILTRGKLPAATWVEIITTAHEVGLRSSATMMYGHVDTPAHWVGHLRTLARIQDQTGGFTEFVPLPFVHQNAPIYLAGKARPGPSARDDRAVHAVARLLLHGRIDHVQCSWVKLGDQGCQTMLDGGADDLGGTLMEETISRMAGSAHGSARTPEQLVALAAAIGRPARERTTVYGVPTRTHPISGVGELLGQR